METALKDKTPSKLVEQFYSSEVNDLIVKGTTSCAADTVGSLGVRALDSRTEGLRSMPNASEYIRSTSSLNQWVRKSCGLNHEYKGPEEIFPSPPVPWQNCGIGDRWWRHLSTLRGTSPS
ncbi:hypothetical protein TNCV_3964971 [Trichonephila clavipes]|nr:hypothetical protein TNCV_3964971 [Trichonephila clavipes]